MNKPAAIAAEISRLRRYARALVGKASQADDLVQECLARALSNQSQWREGASPRKWLLTILHNVYIDEGRRQTRRPDATPLDAVPEPVSGEHGGGIDIMEITDALGRLPEEQRQALLLVSLEGLSYAETAEVLDIPVGTVMSRVARGRERLRHDIYGVDGRGPNLKRVK